jgi:hypothetical protein
MEENKPINIPGDATPPNISQQLNTPSTNEPVAAYETSKDAEPPVTHNLSAKALAKVGPQPVSEQDMEVHHSLHQYFVL